MSRIRRSSLVLPTLTASVLGAGSVVGMAMAGGVINPAPAALATRLNSPAGPVATAATAPPPVQVDLAEPETASAAQDPVRRARTPGLRVRTTVRRTPSAEPGRAEQGTAAQGTAAQGSAAQGAADPQPTRSRFDAVQPVAARIAQPSYTVVVERGRRNRLVAVRVIDPSAPARTAGTRSTPKAKRAPATTWRRTVVGG